MAGASTTLKYDDREVRQAFKRLLAAGSNLEPVFRDIGERLLRSHDERFRRQVGPDGRPWAPLSKRYARRKAKKRPNAGILTFDEHLRRLHYNASPDRLAFGTNRIYGATHQFGDRARNIPARPFLGFSNDDNAEIGRILREHIAKAIR